MEYRLRRHDGEYRWIFDRGVPFQDEQGVFAGYIGSCIDITETVEARKLIFEKQQSEIENLRKMLPICSICKKIRNDEGYYEQIESYFRKHSGVDFSHTICHPCMKEHYPEEYEDIVGPKSKI